MTKKQVWRYFCEFCKKGGFSAGFEEIRSGPRRQSQSVQTECGRGLAGEVSFDKTCADKLRDRGSAVKSSVCEILTYRTCLLCVEIRTVFSCGKELLWESLRDYGFERLTTASPCFAKLSAAAKGLVLERWRKWKGL